MILKKSQPAPYYGVLVPEDTYKKMQADIIGKDLLQMTLEDKNQQYESLEQSAETKQNWFFAIGVLMGAFVGYKVAR